MSVSEFFNGVAVVIDDEIEKDQANINDLITQIEKRNIPCVKYNDLPHADTLDNFQGISFLILDWMILDDDTLSPDERNILYDVVSKNNIYFLQSLFSKCFIPVFIFTNEGTGKIISQLEENNLYYSDKPNFIFVKNKDEFTNDQLFDEISEWIKSNPSVYTLKAWEREYGKAKNLLFLDFYNMNHSWPLILWNNFKNDNVNMSKELGEIINRNLHTRMTPFSFQKDYLTNENYTANKDEIRKVIEGERFIKEERLHDDCIVAGDVFSPRSTNFKEIYLNIRPDCDCVPDRNKEGSTLDDVKLYLIKGDRMSSDKENELYNDDYGNFTERENASCVFSMLDGKSYIFRFKDIMVVDWKNYKDKRIGRLLPPYITRIQQRYAFYLQRQGLPRTPSVAVDKKCDCSGDSDIQETTVKT